MFQTSDFLPPSPTPPPFWCHRGVQTILVGCALLLAHVLGVFSSVDVAEWVLAIAIGAVIAGVHTTAIERRSWKQAAKAHEAAVRRHDAQHFRPPVAEG